MGVGTDQAFSSHAAQARPLTVVGGLRPTVMRSGAAEARSYSAEVGSHSEAATSFLAQVDSDVASVYSHEDSTERHFTSERGFIPAIFARNRLICDVSAIFDPAHWVVQIFSTKSSVPIWYIAIPFLTLRSQVYRLSNDTQTIIPMDYIPQDKASRHDWLEGFQSYLTANAAALGSTPAEASAIHLLWQQYDAAYTAVPPQENAYRSALDTLATKEEALVSEVRSLVAEIQVDADVTDASRTGAGLPIRKTTRTLSPIPATRPVCEVDTSQRLQHTISFRDEGALNKAKPEGVRGCEIWCAIGSAPTNIADARYLATDTATPYLTTFAAADAGKQVHYFLRWVNTRNQSGPWSETTSATVGG